MIKREITCCFFGHRKLSVTKELIDRIRESIENLIINENINTFLFGSKSDFDHLCLEVVTELKKKYPDIKKIYVRAEYPYIDEDYRLFLLEKYDDTYYPEHIINAGRAVYIERNCEMIDKSGYCVIYYDEKYVPHTNGRKSGNRISSGTRSAYEYAKKKNLKLINICI